MDIKQTRGRRLPSLSLLIALALGTGGCAGGDNANEDADSSAQAEGIEASGPSASAVGASVQILSPSEGELIEGNEVVVTLAADGVIILPAGDTTPGSGHHHLYLDEDLTDPSMPVPTIPGRIVHLGDGSSSYRFEGVEPGEHRLIAAVADFAHFPLVPLVVDTVRFTVR
jgi:hypothetical protein